MNTQEEPVVPLSQRHADLPPRWRWWLAAVSPGGVATLLLALVMIGGLFWLRVGKALRTIEAMQAPAQHGMARVEHKVASSGNRRVAPVLSVDFTLQGHFLSTTTEDMAKWQQTVVGDTVSITYHVGKDGNFYIEDWQPPVHKQQVPLSPIER